MRIHLRGIVVPLLAVGAIALACLEDGQAAGVIFKDGFALKGRVRREGDTVANPATGESILVGKGFYLLDEGVRRVVFSARHVEEIIENEVDNSADLVGLTRPFARRANTELKYITEILDVKPWDDNWNRNVKLIPSGVNKPEVAEQCVFSMTPNFVWVRARNFGWDAMYTTRELGPDQIYSLLISHESLREKGGRPDLKKRLTIARFMRQAGWLDQAEEQLTQLAKDLPSEEKTIAEARQAVLAARGVQLVIDLEQAHKAGRHFWARKQLDRLPKEGLDGEQLKRIRDLRAKYDAGEESLRLARRYLKEVPALLSDGDARKPWEEIAAVLLDDLSIDSVGRLETFVKFAQQDERERKQGKPSTTPPPGLMAYAVSGWLLGNGAAEDKADFGLKLWRTRQFVLEYQRSHSANARQKLLFAYEKAGAIPFDELAQLISQLPPAEAEEKVSDEVMDLEAKAPNARKGIPYQLRLPPEYRHSRAYPLLIALRNAGETTKEMMDRWTDLAAQNGYLLVAPEWGGGIARGYGYTVEEHAAVLDVLRDMQRRFNVDADRVFLTGQGEGGAMAFDVGLSHPDLFAGVLPFAAPPRYFGLKYATNGFHVPFYVVSGSLQPNDTAKNLRRQFETWSGNSHPSLWIEYKGRGNEWFGGELTNCFDWMGRRQRPSLPKETVEFKSHRPTDNRFYWLTVDGISERAVIGDVRNFNHYLVPSIVQGKVSEANRLNVSVRGFKQLTVWIGRGMVDFDKPVTISVNQAAAPTTRKITPSLQTLLEDFYQRGDRGRLFLARVDFNL